MEIPEDFPLRRELEVYVSHRAELLDSAPGKYVLIHQDEIVDTFDAQADGHQRELPALRERALPRCRVRFPGETDLRSAGSTLISTPTSTGGVAMPTYAIQLTLTDQENPVVFDAVEVVEAHLADQNIGVLIGRDILANAAFVYVGQPGQCTLAF